MCRIRTLIEGRGMRGREAGVPLVRVRPMHTEQVYEGLLIEIGQFGEYGKGCVPGIWRQYDDSGLVWAAVDFDIGIV